MKVAFFIVGKSVPSSRFRVLQYIPKLEGKGIKCDIYAPGISPFGVSLSILPGPAYHIFKRFTQALIYFPLRFVQIAASHLKSYDVVYIQRPIIDWPPSAFFENYIVRINSKIIFDIDDAVFTRISGESYWRMHQVNKITALSKVIITGNNYLAENIDSRSNNVIVIPTTVDETKFKPYVKKKTEKVCLGWTGTASNFRYLFNLIPVFEKLQDMNDVKIKIISNFSYISELSHIRNIEFCKWEENTEVKDLQEFDIGLMPLKDDPWTRGKCAFKLIQYMAIGIPSIASPVGANNDVLLEGETGYFVKSHTEWIDKIESLINDKSLREKMGRQARAEFLRNYSLTGNVTNLYKVLNEVANG